ncbi:MAG TPA: ABC transporter permease [Methylomusa anaerophila]|uniref:Transport permease protein n=1 Tax=Methylomusa anaerophila TaxID=1930071 RepID=A0A348AEA7_9FIRM|nr:ABC transporter permease [Methylomusa anaerophila]BBB89405.1 inner membrane transport permease YadH [Methylomusa anaerophila]HML90482.1 ABC transporter permease [Methylomusa anaerophila]
MLQTAIVRKQLFDIRTVVWRDFQVFRRHLNRYMFSRMMAPLLYFLSFGWGLGVIASQGKPGYYEFLALGIVVLNTMNISFNSCGFSLHLERLYHKTLDEYLIAPMAAGSFVAGKVISGTLQGLLSAAVICLLAYMFGIRFVMNGWFLLTLALNCMIFAATGFMAAMLIDDFEDIGNVNTFVLLPMSFFCGTFFSIDILPATGRAMLECLPLTHAGYALRAIGAGQPAPMADLAVLFAYVVVLSAGAVWSMRRVRLNSQGRYGH